MKGFNPGMGLSCAYGLLWQALACGGEFKHPDLLLCFMFIGSYRGCWLWHLTSCYLCTRVKTQTTRLSKPAILNLDIQNYKPQKITLVFHCMFQK